MHAFVSYAFLGLVIGLIWGLGCALALLYSIYLAGYRKAVKDSVEPDRPSRYQKALAKIRATGPENQ
jgi:hypothetical protein